MKTISVVTGGGSGIGKALVIELAKAGHTVIANGRRIQKLREAQLLFPKRIEIKQADISTELGRDSLIKELKKYKIQYLIHNAAIIGEITNLENITFKNWRDVLGTNLEAPLFITTALISQMHNSRVLHVSSGAAHNPVQSWGPYCISKAGLFMLYKQLNAELKDKNILIGSIRPGVVATQMQDSIRQKDLKSFPHLQKFHDFHKNNELESPERVAKFILWILTKTSNKDYVAKEWNIKDKDYLKLWDI